MKKIVFLGDSITAGFKQISNEEHILNLAVGGNKTTETMPLIKQTRVFQPDKVFLMIGINDILCNERYFDHGYTIPIYKTYDAIIDMLRMNLPHAEIYLITTLPIRERGDVINEALVKRVNRQILILNEYIVTRAKAYQCKVIDLHSKFIDSDNKLNKNYTIDGIHLSEEGYEIFYSNVKPYFV